MGKADQLLRSVGGMITESASHRGTPAAMPTAPAGSSLTPDRLAGVVRSKTALEIPLDKIEADPSQPREEFDEEIRLGDELVETMRTQQGESPLRRKLVEAKRRAAEARVAGTSP